MNTRSLVARANPEEIKVKETYTFHLKDAFTLLEENDPGQGKIEIHVPFDGKNCVNRITVKDLMEQIPSFERLKNESIRIGYIGFHGYENTDLDEEYSLSLRHNFLPLILNLEDAVFSGADDLTKDIVEQVTIVNYSVSKLNYSPIFFEFVEVTDEYDLFEASSKNPDKFFLESWNEFGNKLVSFDPSMTLTFKLAFDVPSHAKEILKKYPPEITDMSIDWPVATTINHVRVTVVDVTSDSKELTRDVKYDARNQRVLWGNIPFQPKMQEKGVYEFSTPSIQMTIREPGELFNWKELKGKVLVRFPTLFSGLRLSYFDAAGKCAEDVAPIYSTEMNINFSFDLFEKLKQKIYTPYQVIKFPKVILNRMRIDDIATLLRDERFDIISNLDAFPENRVGKEVINFLILAKRDEGDKQLILALDLEGAPSLTEREKEIPEGEKFKSTFGTGEITCRIRGWLPNDPQLIVQQINRIHTLLKHRFEHVSVLD
ncbi:MAG: hypothetical protein CL608_09235 [Anaerolineaceae bacterium]|nr:hypothetical protein [Anaerolineaceae bacterium]